jgi:hypothetical protein
VTERPTAENDAPALRYFIDGQEVTEAEAFDAEDRGTAKVAKGGSGVVPEDLRQSGETREQWLRPWLAMQSTSVIPPGSGAS